MKNRACSLVILALVMAASVVNSGCFLPLLTASVVAPLVGGIMPSDNKVIIDESTVTPELKNALAGAKKLTFVSEDLTDTYAAEYLEQHAGYEVWLEDISKAASPSQRRSLMEISCEQSNKPDLVFSFSSTEMDAGGVGGGLKSALLGRDDYNFSTTCYVLSCQDKWRSQFSVRAEISHGIFDMDQVSLEQVIGVEFAKALMQVAGKSLPPTSSP